MRRALTAVGGMILGMMVGIVFDSLGQGDDEPRGAFLCMVIGRAFEGVVAGLRRSQSSGSN
jgi:hypothetical protein